jgi:predicted transcriptional regulator
MTIYAGSIMTQEVITVGPEDTVRMLAALFTNHGIS